MVSMVEFQTHPNYNDEIKIHEMGDNSYKLK